MFLFKLNVVFLVLQVIRGDISDNDYSFVAIVEQMSALERSLGRALIYEDAPVDSVLFDRFCRRDELRNALKGCSNFEVSRTDCNQEGPVLSSTNQFCTDGAAYSTNGRLTLTNIATQKCAFAIFSPGKKITFKCTQVPANYLKASSLLPASATVVTVGIDQNVEMMDSIYLDGPVAPATPGPLDCSWTSS